MKLQLTLAGLLSVPALLQGNVMSFGYTACEAIAIAELPSINGAPGQFMKQDNSAVLTSSQTSCGATASAGVTGASGSGVVQGSAGFIGASSSAFGASPGSATGTAGASFIDWIQVLPGTKSAPIVETTFTLDLFGTFTGDGGANAGLVVNGGDLDLLALASSVFTREHVSKDFGLVLGQYYPVTTSLGTGAHNGTASFSDTARFHIDVPDGYTLVSLSGINYSSSAPNPEVPEPRDVSLAALGVMGAILAIRRRRRLF